MMRLETKAIANVAYKRLVYSNIDDLTNFLERYDNHKRDIK